MKTGNILLDFIAKYFHNSLNSALIIFAMVAILEINDRTIRWPYMPIFVLFFILLFVLLLINAGLIIDIKTGKIIRGTYKLYFNSFGVIFIDFFITFGTLMIINVIPLTDSQFFYILIGSLTIGFTTFFSLGILSAVKD